VSNQAGQGAATHREKIIMRIPQQVTERVKEAPAQALRAVFSGIGQVLLVADRIKSRASELQRETPPDPGPRAKSAARAQSTAPTAPAPKEESRWRSLDETGNVRLLSQQDVMGARAAATPAAPAAPEPAATPEPAPAPEPAAAAEPAATPGPAPAPEPAAAAEPAASPEPADIGAGPAVDTAPRPADVAPEPAAPAAPGPAALPVPNYDELTVASLRARLRNLDPSQVRSLLDYEKANAGRPAVLTMFERRIAKLESGQA
jgi:hypothetical protein